MVDEKRLAAAVKELLASLGEDVSRDGLKDTPDRVARMYGELTRGYGEDAEKHLSVTFDESSDMVLEKDIEFSSTCEHHLMPFFGKVHIAYFPDGKVVGLSKLARVVDVYSRRLQLQERMNAEIADAIYNCLAPKGVVVIVEGVHTCMTARGVKKTGSTTLTYQVRGDVSEAKLSEIFTLTGVGKH